MFLKFWNSLVTPVKWYIFVGVTSMIIFSTYAFVISRISDQPHDVSNLRTKVNLEPDIGFLDCIRIQHSCLYDHVRKSQFTTIQEDCKDENYCNNSFK